MNSPLRDAPKSASVIGTTAAPVFALVDGNSAASAAEMPLSSRCALSTVAPSRNRPTAT
ncbi:hypothetical protein D3C83_328850 [compost metagenome]